MGEATSHRLAREGRKVALVDIDETGARRVANQIDNAGGVAIPVKSRLVELSIQTSANALTRLQPRS